MGKVGKRKQKRRKQATSCALNDIHKDDKS
jgi:hypothetical protein